MAVRAPAGAGPARLGEPQPRIDGPAKVCGLADYPGDVRLPGLAYAAPVRSAIARGRLVRINCAAALAEPGLLDILTWQEIGEAIRPVRHLMEGGWANSSWPPLSGPDIRYHGQLVALVVANTLEAAQRGALLVRAEYRAQRATARLGDPGVVAQPLATLHEGYEDRHRGDVDAALGGAAAVVEQRYSTPIQHHNPIELPSTTCAWDGDRLTVYEPTRYLVAAQHGLAAQLGLAPEQVRFVSHFIGGHFGSKLALSQHTALCAIAARRLGRPVRLEIGRRANFTIANHRTETRHAIRLGADRDGHFVALSHVAETATSRFDGFAMEGTDVSTALYGCAAVAGVERVARVDRNTPGPMRAPPEVPYLFALESAVDELACAIGIDPVELRRRNDTAVDPVSGKPFTNRPLMRCFDAAAARFDWTARNPQPRARQEDGWWVGHGCAAAARPVKAGPAIVRIAQDAAGAVTVETAHHEIGNGLYTLLAVTASERLGVPLARVTVALGDTALPPAGISGGSSTATTLVNAVARACLVLRQQPEGAREVRFGYVPPGAGDGALAKLEAGHMALATPPEDALSWAFGAHMVEARVHAQTGEVRIARHVGAFAAGRILNPMAARSQFLGGMVWGHGSALLEETLVDPRTGGYVNDDLAEYLVPTAADVPDLEALWVEDDDRRVNPEGVKGLGEIGIIGVNAAIANAVFNATGVRVRDLPIRLEKLI